MTQQEIATILNIGNFDKIVQLCRDRDLLLTILALTYHKGEAEGLKEAHDDMNRLLRSHAYSGINN